MKAAAIAWLVVALCAAAYVGLRMHAGMTFQTDLMALLPHEERDPDIQRAKDRIAGAFGERVVMLFGHADRESSRAAAARMARRLAESGLTRSVSHAVDEGGIAELGRKLFAFRAGLLSPEDRGRLVAGQADEIARRARAMAFGPASFVDAALLRSDPFLLLQNWLTTLPLPLGRVAPDDGVLSVEDGATTWVLVGAQLTGRVLSLDFARRFQSLVDAESAALEAAHPGLRVLRTGPVFFAAEAAATSLNETSIISTVSLLGTVVLIIVVFRSLRTLLVNALILIVALVIAFASAIAIFGEIHVAALLFGVSLIGIAIDYSLHFSVERFSATERSPGERLRRVLPGIALGAGTTVIGYLTLFFAPFPGLRQLAALSAIGVSAAWITVVLWQPALDGRAPLTHGARLLAATDMLWRFWEAPGHRRRRQLLLGLLLLAATAGAWKLRTEDDVRRMQSLSVELRRQESEIRRLVGVTGGGQFLLVRGASTEEVLAREEAMLPVLAAARADKLLDDFRAVAQYVPSSARQRDNRRLLDAQLYGPLLASHWAAFGAAGAPDPLPDSGTLSPAAVAGEGPLAFLADLIVENGEGRVTHVLALYGSTNVAELRARMGSVQGVTLVDPTGDVSALLGEYRRRAVALLVVSAILMLPLLVWRFGLAGGLRTAFPPVASLVLTPLLLSLVGIPLTFFTTIALVLILAMGVDYAIFCHESTIERRAATTLGVWLAGLTTMLSFGLLALSSAFAVSAFGATMLIGVTLSFLLSPLAGTSPFTSRRARAR